MKNFDTEKIVSQTKNIKKCEKKLNKIYAEKELSFDSIKENIKKIIESDYFNKKALTVEEKKLEKSITKMNVEMFLFIKGNQKNFSVFDSKELENIKIDDDGNFSEIDIKIISDFFENNENKSKFFFDLVPAYLFSSKKQEIKNNYHIFYLKLYSKFTSKEEDLFLFYWKKNLYAILGDVEQIEDVNDVERESIFNLKLVRILDYIKVLFGKVDKEIEKSIAEIEKKEDLCHEEFQKKIGEIFCNFSAKKVFFFEGAITFFDFLGWKGLWIKKDGNPLEEVSKLIEDFREYLKKKTKEMMPITEGIEISQMLSISDTIAFFTPEIKGVISLEELFLLHAEVSKYIIEKSIENGYPIRGAITYGEYNFYDNIMIGPGIDECASWHEKCDWVGAHFTPSAELVLNKICDDNVVDKFKGRICKPKGNIPIKTGLPHLNYCVKWFVEKDVFQRMLDKTPALLPEISSKYLNTYEFLYEEGK